VEGRKKKGGGKGGKSVGRRGGKGVFWLCSVPKKREGRKVRGMGGKGGTASEGICNATTMGRKRKKKHEDSGKEDERGGMGAERPPEGVP